MMVAHMDQIIGEVILFQMLQPSNYYQKYYLATFDVLMIEYIYIFHFLLDWH